MNDIETLQKAVFTFAVLGIAGIGFVLGYCVGLWAVRREAVRLGHGEWAVSEDGNSQFRWKKP